MITTDWAKGLAWQSGFDQTAKDLAVLAKNVEDGFVGGTPFFDHLDEALRSDHWFQPLRMWYEHIHARRFGVWPDIALSGTFGQRFAAYLRENGTHNTYVFPGNLRHVDLDPLPLDLTGHEFVFLDDSCYRGRTFGKIKERIEEAGGTMLSAIVLYDGSPLPPFLPQLLQVSRSSRRHTMTDEELWGPMPTVEQIWRANIRNNARLAIRAAIYELLGQGLSDEGKEAWLNTPNPFLGGRIPNVVLNFGMEEVFDAVDQYQQGDFA